MTDQHKGNWPNHNTHPSPWGGIKTSNYSQGQPGGTWPTIEPTPFDRADANSTLSPSGYVHPEFGNTF